MLAKFIIPSFLVATSLNGVLSAPTEGLVARQDGFDSAFGDLISAAIEVLGPSVASELAPLETMLGGAPASATDVTASAEQTDSLAISVGTQVTVTSTPPLSTGGASPISLASTDILTLPGGGLWFPGGYFATVDPFATLSAVSTAATDAPGAILSTADVMSVVSFADSASATDVLGSASASSAPSVSAPSVTDTLLSTAESAAPTAPPSKRDGNIFSAFGGVINSIASEVLPLLPSQDASRVESLTQKLLGSSATPAASGIPAGATASSTSSASPSASATQSSGALSAGGSILSMGSVAGVTVVVCSIFLGSVVGF